MSDSDSIKAYQILRNKLPALRFDDGDVVVKLGVEPYSHLLVHSELIKLAMPTLAPVFKAEWSTPETILHPTKGKEVNVYGLGMKSVDRTLLLEGKDVDLQDEWSVLFHRSELAADGWPVSESSYYSSAFVQLHAAMAEFDPASVQLAMKLQSTKLYCDALRHFIVQNRSDERTPYWATCNYRERPFSPDRAPWTFLNMSQEEYTTKFQPALNKLDAVLGGLEQDLHKL
ncbi:hypothetical protein KC364_g10397 [Hortaea werneckii]|nr:hypothetical protein KC350_g10026 [Hortaea werneckii]KAI7458480.1 hypothetical protein KC364_g10397 [Hortaea werneckii]